MDFRTVLKLVVYGMLLAVIRGQDEVTKFEYHSAVVVDIDPNLAFYGHLERVHFDIPQEFTKVDISATKCTDNHELCQLLKAQDDLSNKHLDLIQRFMSVYHENDDTVAEHWTGDGNSVNYAHGQSSNISELIYDLIGSINGTFGRIKEPGREKRSFAVVAGAAIKGGVTTGILKAVSDGVSSFLGIGGTKSVKKEAKARASPEFAGFHDGLVDVPKIVEQQRLLSKQLESVNLKANAMFSEINGDVSVLQGVKYQLRIMLKSLLKITSEIALNAQSIVIQHSNGLCLSGHLPLTAVPMKNFLKYYRNKSLALSAHHEMLVSEEDIADYYTEKFSTCVNDPKETAVGVPIMYIEKTQRFKYYKLTKIPFQMGKLGTCKVKIDATAVLFDSRSTELVPLRKGHSFNCLKGSKYCQIPDSYGVHEKEYNCLLGLVTNDDVKSKECPVECVQDAHKEYLTSQTDNSIFVSNVDKILVTIEGKKYTYSGLAFVGAIRITLPCLGKIEIEEFSETFYSNVENCKGKIFKAAVVAPKYFFAHSDNSGNIVSVLDIPKASFHANLHPDPSIWISIVNCWDKYNVFQQSVSVFQLICSITVVFFAVVTSIKNFYVRREIRRFIGVTGNNIQLVSNNIVSVNAIQ